jgi:hypothetical protein
MKTLLVCLVIAIPLLMLFAIWVRALCWAAAKPTPPVTGPVGLEDEETDRA